MTNNNNKTEAYKKYVEQRAKGCSTYFDVDEFEDIILDFDMDGDIEGAEEALKIGFKFHPDSEQLKKLHILLLVDNDEFEQARQELEPFLNDGTRQSLNLQYAIMVHDGDYEEACELYMKRIKDKVVDPEDAILAFKDAYNFVPTDILGKYIIQAYNMLIKDYTDGVVEPDAETLHDVAFLLTNIHEYEMGIEATNKALDLEPFNDVMWWNLSRCYYNLDNLDACLEACDFGLAVNPQYAELHAIKGSILYEKKKYKEAIYNFEQAISLFEEGGHTILDDFMVKEHIDNAIEQLSSCYQETDQIDKAIDCWQKLAIRKPGESYIYYNMALLNMDRGNTPWALENINNAIKIEPKKHQFYALKVSLLGELKRYDEAIEAIDELIKRKPRSTTALLAKAQLCLKLHKIDEANKTILQLLKLNPKDKQLKKLVDAIFEATDQDDEIQLWNLND